MVREAATSEFDLILRQVRNSLKERHDPERAENEKRYLKSPHKFLGVNIPTLRSLTKEIKAQMGEASRSSVHKLSRTLWASEYHQEKTLSIFLLAQYPEHLDFKTMPMLERMLSEATGWDHVDYISTSLISVVLEKDTKALAYLEKWVGSDNFWMRRASLISQIPLLRKGKGDREIFYTIANGMLEEKEFFIRKAIGWTVRELSKADPEAARDYLLSIKGRASGLTLREGAKRLPQKMKKEVLGK